MGTPLDHIGAVYSRRYGESVNSPSRLRELYDRYVNRSQASLLDAVAATAAIDAIFLADRVDLNAVTPQMQEAFALAFPGQDLGSRLQALDGLTAESREIAGFISNWKGKYFEVLVADKLNDGEIVGGIALSAGQQAVLAPDLNQPVWDLQIVNADGSVDEFLQLKASTDLGYAYEALKAHPDVTIISTDKIGAVDPDDLVLPSNISHADIQEDLLSPMEPLFDGPVEDFIESVLPGLPLVLVTTTEGGKVLMGRQTLREALDSGLDRGMKTGAAMGIGAAAVALDAGAVSLPITALTRLGISRVQIMNMVSKKIVADHARLKALSGASVSWS